MLYSVTLKKNHEFRRLYSKGKSKASPWLVLYCRKNKTGVNRLGITVGGKLGCAVKRNRVRRRIREVYRLNEASFNVGYDMVVVARVRAVHAEYSALNKTFMELADDLGLLKPKNSDSVKV